LLIRIRKALRKLVFAMVLKSLIASVTGLSAEKRASRLPLSHLRPHTRETPPHIKGQPTQRSSSRTKAALAECKARGIRLDNPRLAELNRTRKQQARQFADQHSNLIQSLRNKGRTLREICDVLNDAGMKTPQGGMFHPIQVHRILKRVV